MRLVDIDVSGERSRRFGVGIVEGPRWSGFPVSSGRVPHHFDREPPGSHVRVFVEPIGIEDIPPFSTDGQERLECSSGPMSRSLSCLPFLARTRSVGGSTVSDRPFSLPRPWSFYRDAPSSIWYSRCTNSVRTRPTDTPARGSGIRIRVSEGWLYLSPRSCAPAVSRVLTPTFPGEGGRSTRIINSIPQY